MRNTFKLLTKNYCILIHPTFTTKSEKITASLCLIGDVCGPPPQVEHADISSIKEARKEVTYECQKHFELKGRPTISCTSRGWDEAPTCECKYKYLLLLLLVVVVVVVVVIVVVLLLGLGSKTIIIIITI